MRYRHFVWTICAVLLAGAWATGPAFAQGGTWETKAQMPTSRWGAGVGVIDGKLYVVGGQGPAGITGTLEVYDPTTDTWSAKAPMPTPRFAPAAEVINGRLHVAGGMFGGCAPVTNVLEVYDPVTDTWSTKAPMPTARERSAAGVIDGKLYVAGGDDECSTSFNVLQVYDPATDTWMSKTPMPTNRSSMGAEAIDGKLYVVGGSPGPGVIDGNLWVYDPATDMWSTKASMPTARDEITNSTGVINGLLYVVGGRLTAFGGTTDMLEVYDPAADTWATATPMPTSRETAAAGVITSRLYVAGGRTFGGPLTSVLEVFTPSVTEITVAIDIKPGSFPNSINPRSKGVIPVAILTTDTYDATTVDATTVRFGKTGTEAAPVQFAFEDVDGDGDADLILHFNTQATGIVCGDTFASLTGKTFSGQMIQGSDSVKTAGCK